MIFAGWIFKENMGTSAFLSQLQLESTRLNAAYKPYVSNFIIAFSFALKQQEI